MKLYRTEIGVIEVIDEKKTLREINIKEESEFISNLSEIESISIDELLLKLEKEYSIDLSSTSKWQRQVWDELKEIPKGETRTYQEIASKLQVPKAARAVGAACASNRLALIIPCHRVVPADGTIGNYRWGTGKKEELLAFEAMETS